MHQIALLGLIPVAVAGTNAPLWTPAAGCPSAIDATIPGYNPHELPSGTYNFDVYAVHEALTNCPQIHSLDLRFTLMGCSEWPPRWNLPFNQGGGETYPALTHLGLEGYGYDGRAIDESPYADYYDGQRPGESYFSWWWRSVPVRLINWIKMRLLPAEQRNKTNLELWLDAMDFSKLESISLPDGLHESFKEKVTPRLQGLKRLSIDSDRNSHEVLKWIEQLPELTELKWINWHWSPGKTLDHTLERHGRSLERLELRNQETLMGRRDALSARQLSVIPTSAPNLKFLSVDLRQDGHWPFNELKEFALNLELENLEIWFEFASEIARQPGDDRPGRDEEEMYQRPRLDGPAAKNLNQWLRKIKQGKKFQEIVFFAGDWSRPWDGPLYFPDWLDGKGVKYICDENDCNPPPQWGYFEEGEEDDVDPEMIPVYPASQQILDTEADQAYIY